MKTDCIPNSGPYNKHCYGYNTSCLFVKKYSDNDIWLYFAYKVIIVVTSTNHMVITTNPYLILLFICIQEKELNT